MEVRYWRLGRTVQGGMGRAAANSVIDGRPLLWDPSSVGQDVNMLVSEMPPKKKKKKKKTYRNPPKRGLWDIRAMVIVRF